MMLPPAGRRPEGRPPLPQVPDSPIDSSIDSSIEAGAQPADPSTAEVEPQAVGSQAVEPQVVQASDPPKRGRGHHGTKALTRRPPQGKMTLAQKRVSPAEEAAFATMEVEMGGRAGLVATLSTAQLPRDVETVLGMIADPLHDHESLAKICALGNVSLAQLLKVFQTASRTRSHLIAHQRIAEALPDVAAAVMEGAKPGWKTCIQCMGTTQREQPFPDLDDDGKPLVPKSFHLELAPCPDCQARGVVWFEPDHETQKTALKLGGLLDTGKGGMNLNILQQNTQVNPGDTGNYDKLMEALDGAIYGTGRDRFVATDGQDEEWVDGAVDGAVDEAAAGPEGDPDDAAGS